MIEGATEHLTEKGLLEIVGRHNKGGKSYQEEMAKHFDDVQSTGISSGYRVYVAKNIKSNTTS